MIPTSPNMVDAGPVRYAQIPSATSFTSKTLGEMRIQEKHLDR